jgi:hypothetical protein
MRSKTRGQVAAEDIHKIKESLELNYTIDSRAYANLRLFKGLKENFKIIVENNSWFLLID